MPTLSAVAQMALRLFLLSLLLLPLQLPMISVCILSNGRRGVECIQFDFRRRPIVALVVFTCVSHMYADCTCRYRSRTYTRQFIRRRIVEQWSWLFLTLFVFSLPPPPVFIVVGFVTILLLFVGVVVDVGRTFWIYCQMIYLKFVLNVVFCRWLRSDRLLNIHYDRFFFRWAWCVLQRRFFFVYNTPSGQ